jgi:hypothetical protein
MFLFRQMRFGILTSGSSIVHGPVQEKPRNFAPENPGERNGIILVERISSQDFKTIQ